MNLISENTRHRLLSSQLQTMGTYLFAALLRA